MKLEHAKKLIYVVGALVIAAAVVLGFLEGTARTVCWVVVIALLILDAVLCSKFLRCPHCGKRFALTLYEQRCCPACGKPLDGTEEE